MKNKTATVLRQSRDATPSQNFSQGEVTRRQNPASKLVCQTTSDECRPLLTLTSFLRRIDVLN